MRFIWILAALMLPACGNSAVETPRPAHIDALSTTDVVSNAEKLRQFIEQQCFERLDNIAEFDVALKAAGWPVKRMQTADSENNLTLDRWELPGVTLLRSQPIKGRVWTCTLMVKASVAPPDARIRSALSEIAGGRSESPDGWWWKRSLTSRIHMELESSGQGQGLTINIENYHFPWWRSLLE